MRVTGKQTTTATVEVSEPEALAALRTSIFEIRMFDALEELRKVTKA